jgi:hypothetical protein
MYVVFLQVPLHGMWIIRPGRPFQTTSRNHYCTLPCLPRLLHKGHFQPIQKHFSFWNRMATLSRSTGTSGRSRPSTREERQVPATWHVCNPLLRLYRIVLLQ